MSKQRISRLEVQNFKSLVDFEIDLPKFSCLIGLNGAGKSTVLQFIDFLSQLVRGDVKGWLAQRKWKSADLKSKLTKKVNIEFCVRFCDENGGLAGRWDAIYSPSRNQCTKERIELADFVLQTTSGDIEAFCVKKTPPKSWKDWKSQITFSYEGSILSALKEDLLPPNILDCKKRLAEIKSLDLLAPEQLRQRTRGSSGTLGLGGQNLASFLHEMSDARRRELVVLLKRAYPRLQGLAAKSLRSGWKQLEISENFQAQESGFLPVMTTEARHINDGMLRLIAILAELQSGNRFLLFDEIENGINPELVEFVMTLLVEARQQVLVTTHSPMILNYLEDEVAKRGVIYLFKTVRGATEAIPFFSIPSLRKKLEVMGPGEAFVDTNLNELAEEIRVLQEEE
jgi:ABC-type multidrug transport system ATPase subunit